MIALLQQFLKIAFLTGKPYDLPGDRGTLQLAVTLSFLTYVIATWQLYPPAKAISHAVLDLVLAGSVFYIALSIVGKSARFSQSFAALCGANAVLNAATLPIILTRLHRTESAAAEAQQQPHLIEFFFLVWSISVVAHVIRFSFDTNIPISIVAAVGYILLALTIFDTVF